MKNIISKKEKNHIDSICNKLDITDYTINNDGSIDVDGNVDLYSRDLTELPLIFNKVSRHFDCSDNQLTTLKGCPKKIGGNFDCSYNKLTSLEYLSSSIIKGDINVSKNKLTNLIGSPRHATDFECQHNFLTSLEGCPSHVDSLDCSNNDITTFLYFPDTINRLYFMNNSFNIFFLKTVKSLEYDEHLVFIKYLNHYDFWNPTFDKERFMDFIEDIKDGLR